MVTLLYHWMTEIILLERVQRDFTKRIHVATPRTTIGSRSQFADSWTSKISRSRFYMQYDK